MNRQGRPAQIHTFNIPDLEGLEADCREFAVATADGADRVSHEAFSRLLRRVRDAFGMDVVFVSEFRSGRRIFRHVDAGPQGVGIIEVGASDPLEESYCQRMVDGRLPQAIRNARDLAEARELPATQAIGIGGHLSVPILLVDGSVYGTLCCFSREPKDWLGGKDAKALSSLADLIATGIQKGTLPTA